MEIRKPRSVHFPRNVQTGRGVRETQSYSCSYRQIGCRTNTARRRNYQTPINGREAFDEPFGGSDSKKV
jgi:hypothetical protein